MHRCMNADNIFYSLLYNHLMFVGKDFQEYKRRKKFPRKAIYRRAFQRISCKFGVKFSFEEIHSKNDCSSRNNGTNPKAFCAQR